MLLGEHAGWRVETQTIAVEHDVSVELAQLGQQLAA